MAESASAGARVRRVPVEERLFSLVLALLATTSGLTKNEILSTVRGYSGRFSAGGDNANLERQFERDKDSLRDLGVPLDTIESPSDPGNNQNLRYRISHENYDLPADISFSAAETAMLNLAAAVWREGSLSAESRRALLKVRSLGAGVAEPVLAYAPTARVRDAAFEPLAKALEQHITVRFAYLKPGDLTASVRTVRPLALVQHAGRWLLTGDEPAKSARRTFLLSRIVGAVALVGPAFIPPAGDEATRASEEVLAVWERNIAVVEVELASDAAARLVKRRGTVSPAPGILLLHYSDLNILADELCSFGPELIVTSPAELREAVSSRLRAVAAAHLTEDSDG